MDRDDYKRLERLVRVAGRRIRRDECVLCGKPRADCVHTGDDRLAYCDYITEALAAAREGD
jgi:hypothetical protein